MGSSALGGNRTHLFQIKVAFKVMKHLVVDLSGAVKANEFCPPRCYGDENDVEMRCHLIMAARCDVSS